MSLFQCEQCVCKENTALCNYHLHKRDQQPLVCSACDLQIGKWHGKFDREYLEPKQYVTNREGNLERKPSKSIEELRAAAERAVDQAMVHAQLWAIQVQMTDQIKKIAGALPEKNQDGLLEFCKLAYAEGLIRGIKLRGGTDED